MQEIHQGDILKVERITRDVLVLSKDFFNRSGEVIGCPVYGSGEPSALHIPFQGERLGGIAHCEKLNLLDLRLRGYTRRDRISMKDLINISDAVQAIFEYI